MNGQQTTFGRGEAPADHYEPPERSDDDEEDEGEGEEDERMDAWTRASVRDADSSVPTLEDFVRILNAENISVEKMSSDMQRQLGDVIRQTNESLRQVRS